jgi:N-acetyl-gamma-glutamyl-phosphate reductase
MNKIKVAVIGASGFTGAQLVDLLLKHHQVEIKYLVAQSNAGANLADFYGVFSRANLPKVVKFEEVDFDEVDVAFCCLPHATSQEIISKIYSKNVQVIDLSADFRLDDVKNYQKWYKNDHLAPDLQKNAVYGLSEFSRGQIKKGKIIACPGCYPTSILLPLLPLMGFGLIDEENIIVDAKSGISGAGKSLKESNLFCSQNENSSAYNVGIHRHLAEIEQELTKKAQKNIQIEFTPHLIPVNRGIISTIYVNLQDGHNIDDIANCLQTRYEDEYFVEVNYDQNKYLSLKDVVFSNMCKIAIYPGNKKNTVIIVSVIDNLIKGAAGPAVQNMNRLYKIDEKMYLDSIGLFF